MLRFHSCGSTEQEELEHQEIVPESSVGLEVFVEPVVNETVPDVLGSNKLIECNSHNTTAESWERLYTGQVSKDEASYIPTVSLLQAKQTFGVVPRQLKTQWDLDSILAFLRSLAFAKCDFVYSPNLLIIANISTNIYLTILVPDLSDLVHLKDICQPLKKVLHYCFGKVNSFPELSIFLFFL